MALKVSQKVQLYDREVVLWQKNVLKRAFGKNVTPVKWQRGSNGREGEKMGFLGAASTAAAVANVTNASFKSSTVPLQTILLACEPSERKSKDTAAV